MDVVDFMEASAKVARRVWGRNAPADTPTAELLEHLLERCGVASSRAPARACVSLVLRAAATVSMEGCELSGCSSGVLLSSAAAKLVARGCAFRNVRAAIASERGGRIEVDHCAFDLAQSLGDVGFKLAGDTVGHVSECEIGEAQGPQLWGRIVPPEGVRLGPRSTGLAP